MDYDPSFPPKLQMLYVEAQKEFGRTVARDTINHDFALFPKRYYEAVANFGSTKSIDFCFIGGLRTDPATERNRNWILDFIVQRFTDQSYLQFTDRNTKKNYEPKGKFDFTLERDGFVPKEVPITRRSFFDATYYETLSKSRFTLCPAGDTPWSMRFYEALMCKSIPIVNSTDETFRSKVESELGYKFYLSDEEPVYREDWIGHNYELFMRYHTLKPEEQREVPTGAARSDDARSNFNERNVYAAAFDRPPFDGEQVFYLLCCAPGVGSWLLCDLLEQSDVMGVPAEYFNPYMGLKEMASRFGLMKGKGVEANRYVQVLKEHRTTSNGVFGVKLQYWMMPQILRSGLIGREFPDARFLYMDREDLLGQAISHYKALANGAWAAASDAPTVAFDEAKIHSAMNKILSQRMSWERFFAINNIKPLRFRYEDLIADPTSVCGQLCRFVGAETAFPFTMETARIRRQGNDQTQEWRVRLCRKGSKLALSQ